jgi:hypothetical protein
MFADIYNWFTEGFELADLKKAKGDAGGPRGIGRHLIPRPVLFGD